MLACNALLYPLRFEGIVISILCGLIIGAERQISGKPAGVRTSILICLGTYVFVAASQAIQGDNVDKTRIIGQIVTGIGFIGAGVILTREGIVIGVTSAAVIWLLAGIGVLIGLGRYAVSVVLCFVAVFVLAGVSILEEFLTLFRKGVYSRLKRSKQSRSIDLE